MLKATIIVSIFWLVLLQIIYFAGIWPGFTCDRLSEITNKYNTSLIFIENTANAENQAWFKKHPEYYPQRNISTLKLLHILVRHGDRTNLRECQYPSDPYLNETYEPVGIGQMTNLGKRRMFEVGRSLRHQYNDFLGDYSSDYLDAVTSELRRSQASLELILAGLYPPSEDLTWLKGFSWQPIPYIANRGKDNLLGNPRHNCDNWTSYYAESHARFEDVLTNQSDYFDRLTTLTGWSRNLLSVNLLYNYITTNLAWGHELPEDLQLLWPEPTMTLNRVFWKAFTDTERTQIAGGGGLLKKILDDTTAKVLDSNHHQEKLHLYSASDYNIMFLLRILGAELYDNPLFGSHIIIELHQDQDETYLQFFYRQNFDGPLLELQIPDCRRTSKNGQLRCLFDDFLLTRERFVPEPNFC